jgi:hypothetical protein
MRVQVYRENLNHAGKVSTTVMSNNRCHGELFFNLSNGKQKLGKGIIRDYLRGKYHCTMDLLFDWFGISWMTTDNFCFYLSNQ